MMISIDVRKTERAVARVYLQAVPNYIIIIAVKEKMHVETCLRESAAIIATNGSGAYDTISQLFFIVHIFVILFITKVF